MAQKLIARHKAKKLLYSVLTPAQRRRYRISGTVIIQGKNFRGETTYYKVSKKRVKYRYKKYWYHQCTQWSRYLEILKLPKHDIVLARILNLKAGL